MRPFSSPQAPPPELPQFLTANKLEPNTTKTKTMLISHRVARLYNICLKEKSLENVSSYKYLGYYIGNKLTHCEQQNYMDQQESALTFAYNSLAKKLEGQSFRPLISVMAAKTLPTLMYASAALYEKTQLF